MSSHDVLADRRLQFARMLGERGDHCSALSLCEETLALVPDWEEAHFLMAETLEKLGRLQDAAVSYKDYLRLSACDLMGAEVRLAILGLAPVPEILPASYVEALFDDYAARFDQSLVTRLHYTAPQQIRSLVDRLHPDGEPFSRLLDLGCGTGLGGEAFRDLAGWMRGVDLSGGMIAEARRKGVYDELAQEDILTAMNGQSPVYDLVLATDVMAYVGDLQPVFQAVWGALSPGGLFAFSVQRSDGGGYELGRECRYSHHPDYLRDLLDLHGFDCLALEDAVCRCEAGKDVPGMIAVLRRPVLTLQLPKTTSVIKKPASLPVKRMEH